MDRNYIAFIIAYDYTEELELLDLACDEGFELALYMADKFKNFCYCNGWEETYELLQTYCNDVVEFEAMLHNMRGDVDEPKTKKYIVYLKTVEYGFVEVEATSEEDAREQAIIAENEGCANWGDSHLYIEDVEEKLEV